MADKKKVVDDLTKDLSKSNVGESDAKKAWSKKKASDQKEDQDNKTNEKNKKRVSTRTDCQSRYEKWVEKNQWRLNELKDYKIGKTFFVPERIYILKEYQTRVARRVKAGGKRFNDRIMP